ncbi:unnamed protein product [Diplocarpon coronariae]|uniref:Myb-like domain-containing protein n=1 Tax=Diplocarpon coronariae TaxID=2795749 RepID=A0A218YVI7_9HELO|nr:hypothetical protein B2J93_5810 [Marssonina coronariae]
MPSQWDHKADKDLLLVIIDEGTLKGIAWPTISDKMSSKGYTFTHEGCRQHFQKIRKEARGGIAKSDSGPSSPSKRTSSKTTPRKSSSGKGGKGPADCGSGEVEDDDEELPPPPSKRRRGVKKEEPKFEPENSQQAYQFKVEQTDMYENAIDLENDE